MTKTASKSAKWSPSQIAGALGTFGFLIAAIFLGRIIYVHQYRSHSGLLQEETQRVGILLDRQIQTTIQEVDAWRTQVGLQPGFQTLLSGPPILGAKAYRVYVDEAFRAEWLAAGFERQKYGIEGILVRDPETRLASVGADLVALSWRAADRTINFLVFEKSTMSANFEIAGHLKSKMVMLLVNSMDQTLLQSNKDVGADAFRGNVQYKYDGRGVVQIQDMGHDVFGFLSIPSAKGLVLMSRTSRD